MIWNNNYFACNNYLSSLKTVYTSFFTVFADTKYFHLQHIYNVENDQSSNFPTSHQTHLSTNIKFEDAFFQCFVKNASIYKYKEEIFLDRLIDKQEKLYKNHQRFYEYVKKTKSIKSTFDVKKRYLNASNQINCQTYFYFHKGDHVRKNTLLEKKYNYFYLNYF